MKIDDKGYKKLTGKAYKQEKKYNYRAYVNKCVFKLNGEVLYFEIDSPFITDAYPPLYWRGGWGFTSLYRFLCTMKSEFVFYPYVGFASSPKVRFGIADTIVLHDTLGSGTVFFNDKEEYFWEYVDTIEMVRLNPEDLEEFSEATRYNYLKERNLI